MSPEQLSAARELLRLKQVLRRGWTRHPIPNGEVESVADHTFGVALLALLFCPAELDKAAVLELALVHDLAEVRTGDITPHDGISGRQKAALEAEAMSELISSFPSADHLSNRFSEYTQGLTPEARWVKALDKLEMSLQSLNYEDDYDLDLSEFRRSAKGALELLGVDQILNP